MNTFFEIHIPIFHKVCPEEQTALTCPLRSFIKQDKTYKMIAYQNLLVPDTNDWVEARNAIDKMHEICAKCQKDRESQK